ncbi:MAG TPA: hypothetical protein VM784_08960 [Actinomycetota bacterium]|nr:hypothetical protein [Actinomycetota bacterium]
MTSGVIASFAAVLALGLIEGMNRFYPARRTWERLRSLHGRRAVRAMRERFEAAATERAPKFLAMGLAVLVVLWVGVASPLLDKRWYETALDALPYVFVSVALLRVPAMLRAIAERMKAFEKEAGSDPDSAAGDGGPDVIAL